MKGRTLTAFLTGAAATTAVNRVAHRSGVTDEEVLASLPGDDLVSRTMFETNRGITIARPPEAIWPWLVQMGYGRAGWYTPEAFDRWANRWIWHEPAPYVPSPWHVLPQHQHVAVGDVIADGPDYAAYFHVTAVEENRHLVLRSLRHPWRGKAIDPQDEDALTGREEELREGGVYLEFSWAFILVPRDRRHTRLLIRHRSVVAPRFTKPAATGLLLIDAYEAMGMLRGIKCRAEQH